MKKTNSKPKAVGGVNKDPSLRVKVKMLPAPMEFSVTPTKKKRVVEDDEDDEPVVKKKKREVTVVEEEPPKRISKLKTKKLRSIFGDGAEKILQLLDTNDTDTAVALIYKKTLSSLVDLLPYAEHAVRKSKGARGVYQINSLISSMRELMVDIQSAQDRGMMGTALMDSVMRPTFADVAQDIVQEYGMISADAKNGMTDKEFVRFRASLMESRARLADKITKHYRRVNEQTVAFLQG